MKRAATPAFRSASAGVLDAGVVMARLESTHRAHHAVRPIFERSLRRETRLHISVVNLAEVLQHARPIVTALGLDPVAFLTGFDIFLHSPDTDIARRVADLAELEDVSLADRFAAATALALGARLYTTDAALVRALKPLRLPITKL